MDKRQRLKQKVILVTGGAQGLGRSISTLLVEEGATVIIGDIQEDKAEDLVTALSEPGRENGNAVFKHLDLRNEQQVADLITHIQSVYGTLDVIINNAGIDFTKSILDLAVSEWDAAMAVNLRGAFLTAKFGLAVMAGQQSGYIINIISTAALRAWPEASVYHASKWGLRGFTQALFTEARRVNVKVTGLIAGGMQTPFLLDRFPDIQPEVLQDPANVAAQVRDLLLNDTDTVIPELMVIPFQETSWP